MREKRKRKAFKMLIPSLIAALLIFVPAMAAPHTAEAAVTTKLDYGYEKGNASSGTSSSLSGTNYNVNIKIEYMQTEARKMLNQLNNWRAGKTWYYTSKNSKSKKELSGLKALKYDYTLEKYAMQRAAEIAISLEHTRPKGDERNGLLGYLGIGENIAGTTNGEGKNAAYALNMFKEEDKLYDNQGHRRNMLSVTADYDAVGVSCAYLNGCYYWVQIFGITNKPDTTATKAVNEEKTVPVEVKPSLITSKSCDLSAINTIKGKLYKKQESLPQINVNLGFKESWPYQEVKVSMVPNWSLSDKNIAKVNNGVITPIKSGTANLTAKDPFTGISKTVNIKTYVPDTPVEKIVLNKTSLRLDAGKSEKLIATLTPSNATNKKVTWTSSNTAVATVASDGTVKGIKAGTATITAKAASGKTATCKVTVQNVGWVYENGVWLYYKDGKKVTGWYYFTSKEGEKTPHWSYFDKNGKMLKGWQQLGKGTDYPDKNNAKHWSYFGDNGWLRTGWQEMGNGTNNPDNGNNKHWSYFGDNGWLRTGWQEMGNGTNNPDNGNNKHWSYFGDNGWLRFGKQTINKKTYTFNDKGWLTNPSKP